jgi:hypothetical protein
MGGGRVLDESRARVQSRSDREGGSWRVSFNVQNLFDEDPPIIPSSGDTRFGAQATDNTYDEWGRRYEIGFSMEL